MLSAGGSESIAATLVAVASTRKNSAYQLICIVVISL